MERQLIYGRKIFANWQMICRQTEDWYLKYIKNPKNLNKSKATYSKNGLSKKPNRSSEK